MKKKNTNKIMYRGVPGEPGFTLIELLAVIVILGLLMAIAIPSVTKYIMDSRKKTLITTICNFGNVVISGVNNLEYGPLSNGNNMYYIPIECISLEKGGKDPFGNWKEAYVVVNYRSDKYSYDYYFTFIDDAGYGMELTPLNEITKSKIINPATIDEDTIKKQTVDGKLVYIMDKNSCNSATATLADGYVVTFNSMGGSSVPSVARTYNQPVGELVTPSYQDHNFLGWYTEDGNTKISSSTPVTESVTYYAHWAKVICKKATSLHKETCYHNPSVDAYTGCHNAGIADNTTLTYGSLATGNSFVAGNAFDCDVNNDGVYNSATERFYFIRKKGTGENTTYAFVFYNNVDSSSNISNTVIYTYDLAATYLPSASKWTAPGLVKFNGKVSRFINKDDLKASCGSYTTAEGYLDACTYYLENTRYQSNTLGRSCIWIENTGSGRNRIDSRTRRIYTGTESAVRPVIEVPYNNME